MVLLNNAYLKHQHPALVRIVFQGLPGSYWRLGTGLLCFKDNQMASVLPGLKQSFHGSD